MLPVQERNVKLAYTCVNTTANIILIAHCAERKLEGVYVIQRQSVQLYSICAYLDMNKRYATVKLIWH